MKKSKNSSVDQYLEHVAGIAGGDGKFFRCGGDSDLPIIVAAYDAVPEPGCLTAFTFGLSSATHPEWINSRPELVISVNSTDYAWALAMGEMVNRGRSEHLFSYGSILNFGQPVSDESAMSAFLVFACDILEDEDITVSLNDRIVHISQIYPIYTEEISLIKKIGAEKFFSGLDIDFFDIRRPPVISM